MATYTIKIDMRNKAAKALIELMKVLPFIEFIEDQPKSTVHNKDSESQYDPAFVAKIKKAQKQIEQGEFTEIDTDDIWGSMEL